MISPGMTRSPEWPSAVAMDFDDTLAEDGVVEPAVLDGLKRLKASGRRLVLVTGREIDDLVRTFPAVTVFDRVVGENGAVLYRPETGGSIAFLGVPPRDDFIARLRREHVTPLSVGQVIVATRAPHETRVVEAIRALDLDLVVIRNKEAVLVLPKGINKGSGLLQALGDLKISPQEVIGVGDAENDFDPLEACGYGVAIANALAALAQRANTVTSRDSSAKTGWMGGRWDRHREWEAGCQLFDYRDRRVARLERAIRVIAASDLLSEDQRRELLSGVYGHAVVARRGAVVSETERELVDHYRGMDAAGKRMLRTLCARLSTSSTAIQISLPVAACRFSR
jgi:hydroxymethylpyrimidine pyrophosphatase-like HAD family hydrolase